MEPITISVTNGWYNFQQVPQEGRYIKIQNMACSSDKKALALAKKLYPEGTYVVQPKLAQRSPTTGG